MPIKAYLPPTHMKIENIEIGVGKQVPEPVKIFLPHEMRETGNIKGYIAL